MTNNEVRIVEVEIERGLAVTYKGNYSDFLEERELRREQQQREYENQRSLINKTEEFIRRNLEGQKTKQAKSRRNMLQRMDRIEAVTSEKSGGSFGLKKVERTGNNVLTIEDLAIGYPKRTLATGLNLSLLYQALGPRWMALVVGIGLAFTAWVRLVYSRKNRSPRVPQNPGRA